MCSPRVKLAQYRSLDPINTGRDVRWNRESAGVEGVKRGSVCCLVSPRVTAIRNNPLLGFILSAPQGVVRKRRTHQGAVSNQETVLKPPFPRTDTFWCSGYGEHYVVHLREKGIAGSILMHKTSVVTCSCSPHRHTPSATMTPTSTSGSSSVFKDEKLNPGIYKIQNIHTDTYLDIEVSTREVCCRPAKDLGEGRGLVRWYLSSVIHVSDG